MEEKTYQLQLDGSYKVVQSNDLIRGSQGMSLREAQLLSIVISQVVREDKDFKTYTTTIEELARFLEVTEDTMYRDIESITTKLLSRVVKINTGVDKRGRVEWKKFQWLESAEYKGGKLTLCLHRHMKPYLLDLDKNYAQILLKTLCKFKSYYSLRLYQIIIADYGYSHETKDVWEFSCEDIRRLFGVAEKEYKGNNPDLIKRTIATAVSELNSPSSPLVYITDFEKTYNAGKGKPVAGVRFKAKIFNYEKYAFQKEFYLANENGTLNLPGQLNLLDEVAAE